MTGADGRRGLGPAYRKLWFASTISNLGDGVDQAALPLLAVSLTQDPRLIGGLAVALGLPWLLFALVAGALVDRLDRRRVMWTTDLARAGLVAVLAVAATTGRAHIVLLYLVAFALGTAETLFDNAAQAVLPSIVEPAQLETANGRQYVGEVVANSFAGPPVGALLFTVAVGAPFWLDAASFLAAAALVAWMRPPRPTSVARAAAGARRSLRRDIAEGVRWLGGHRLLRTLAGLLGTLNFASNLGFSTFVLLATEEMGLSARAYGVVLTATAVGAALGGLAAGRVTAGLGQARALVAAVATFGVTFIVIGTATTGVVVGAALAVNGFVIVVWNVVTVSLRQAIVPAALLGRVNSVYRTIGWGSIPLGALAGGFLADALGTRAPWFVGAAIAAAALVVAAARLRQPAIDAARAAAASAPDEPGPGPLASIPP